ncbi:MAG TPA: type II toxin-antitoxin system VapC family toxin [Candidatus Acidoferrum sp.]|jgi:PIN domain nuclease of toxin-antitoxin system|nr:type II toxin-antitoxin system VapC family toxin [Candidatus Acidoferrum sp.]
MGGIARLKLLLDTHIWLWFRGDTTRLGRHASAALKDAGNELWLSPISTWEALALHNKGRVQLHGNLIEWVASATMGIKEAVLTHEIVAFSQELPLHKDPADRLIAATAKVLDLTLVTADDRLLELAIIKTLANR